MSSKSERKEARIAMLGYLLAVAAGSVLTWWVCTLLSHRRCIDCRHALPKRTGGHHRP